MMHDTYRAVMDAAAGQCECTGQCGARKDHGANGKRCERDRHRCTIVAAPRTAGVPITEAAGLPAADLMAWCPECLTKAEARVKRTRTRAAKRELAEAQGGLFELPAAG